MSGFKCHESISGRFVQHKIERHSADQWVVLFCDKIKAHLDNKVREIIGNEKVF